MNGLGRHVLAEFYGCDRGIINDIQKVEQHMVTAAVKAGAIVVAQSFHKFAPQGVSGVVVIAESHLAFHSWPEHDSSYAAVDVFTCGDKVNPYDCLEYLLHALKAEAYDVHEVKRGVFGEDGKPNPPWKTQA